MKILVRLEDRSRSLTLKVESSDTVYKVKVQIQREENISIEQQTLFYHRRQLEDHLTLADYGLRGMSFLDLVPPVRVEVQVFVRTLCGKTITVVVDRSDTIAQAKKKIGEKQWHPIHPNELRLLFAGKELDNEKTVADYNIEKESTLHLVIRNRGGA